ncbi:Kinesin light chain 1 [Hondaea fermentalgiana]|uniref:Kinesin light chain 1 n=1 Tax=Hondaea fermentalgiana TaxID=2315210 RepID=A0A2R5GBD3_9STRA|nr:Kinesin light chain 1 [Hondaea fermentalgiana]|eukprot:GBG27915.1 Kinesin light chain 1 [Hondaea fermentalgiana]
MQMEWNLHKLRNSLERERAKAPSTKAGAGPIWQSASTNKGSLRAFASDVRGGSRSQSTKGASRAAKGNAKGSCVASTKPKKRILRGNECPEWTKSDVQQWLHSLGLEKYKKIFAENEIDGAVLLELGVDDLDYMNINALAHRKALLKEVARLKRCIDPGTDGRPSSRQLQPLRSGRSQYADAGAHDAAQSSPRQVPVSATSSSGGGGYQGGLLDEAAEHEAFKRAVEEWRNGGSSTTKAQSQSQTRAKSAKDGSTEDGPALREIVVQSARGGANAVEGEGKSDQPAALHGVLDEEAERRAFQEAVQEWRNSGGAASRVDVVDYKTHKQGARAKRSEKVQAMLEAYETNLKKKNATSASLPESACPGRHAEESNANMSSRDAKRTQRLSKDRSQRLSQRQLEAVPFVDGNPRRQSLRLAPSPEVVQEAERKLVASNQSGPGHEVFPAEARAIIDPRSISFRAVKAIYEDVLSGALVPDVELFEVSRDLSEKITIGTTIKVLEINNDGSREGRVHYANEQVTFMPGTDAKVKKRSPLQRAWCVWETLGAVKFERPLRIAVTPGEEEGFEEQLLEDPDEIAKIMADNNDMRNAKCYKAEDKKMIDDAVREIDGDFTKLNMVVNDRVREWHMQMARQAVVKARQRENEEGLADILWSAGALFNSQGLSNEALTNFEEALSIRKEILGDRHPDVATTLNNIASVYDSQGRYEEALANFEEAQSIRRESLGDRHPDVGGTLNNIAAVYSSQSRYEEALAYYEEDLSISKESLGDRHPDVAITLIGIANEALSIRRESLGDRHPDVGGTLNNIAAVYYSQSRYEEALEYYEEDLSISKESLGDRHPDVAITLICIANVYHRQGRYEEALAYYEEALSIDKESLSDRHPDVATTLNNIANVYGDQGLYEEALAYYEEALSIRKESLGDRHPDVAITLNNIASVYDSQGRYEVALAYCEEALSIKKESLGDRHPSVATTLSGIANVYKAQGRYEAALAYYEEALSIYKESLGDRHPYVA